MAVGAKDHIDLALVRKYAKEKVDNPVIESSMVDPDKMLEAMKDYAQMQYAMMAIRNNLRNICTKAMAPGIKYRKSKDTQSLAKPA